MKLFYKKSDNEILLFDNPERKDIAEKYQLGYLLLSFLDLVPEKILKIIVKGFNVTEITSEKDYEEKRIQAIKTYKRLVELHPYFNHYSQYFDKTFSPALGNYELEYDITYGFNFKVMQEVRRSSQLSDYETDTDYQPNVDGIQLDSNHVDDSKKYSSYTFEETFGSTLEFEQDIPDIQEIQRNEPVDMNFSKADRIYSTGYDEDVMRRFRDTLLSGFLEAYNMSKEAIHFCFMANASTLDLDELDPIQRFYVYQSKMVQNNRQYYPIRPERHLIIEENYDDYTLNFRSNSIEELIAKVKNKEPIDIEVQNGDPLSLCIYELKILATKNARIKNCVNCGKPFFVQTNHDMKYCDRLFEDTDKTCKQIGPILIIKEKRSKDPVAQIYAKAYSRFRSKMYKGLISQEVFEEWKSWAVKLRDNTRADTIEFGDFTRKLSIENDEDVIRDIENNLMEQGVD